MRCPTLCRGPAENESTAEDYHTFPHHFRRFTPRGTRPPPQQEVPDPSGRPHLQYHQRQRSRARQRGAASNQPRHPACEQR